jgi:hypothetical protein
MDKRLEDVKRLLGGVPEGHPALQAVELYLAWRSDIETDAALLPALGDEGRHFNAGRASGLRQTIEEWSGLVRVARDGK